MPSSIFLSRRGVVFSVLAVATLSSSCSATAPKTATPVQELAVGYVERARWEPASDFIPVMRHGRYTLVELAPSSAQRDLLRQLVHTDFATSRNATVGDALRQVLGRSGYRLCGNADLTALQSLPLPASHHRMGPMMLRDVLLTLAGPGWDLSVDDNARQVCFTRIAPLVTTPVNLDQAVEAGMIQLSPAVVRKRLK